MPITLLDGGEDIGMDDPFDDNLDELGFFIECRENKMRPAFAQALTIAGCRRNAE